MVYCIEHVLKLHWYIFACDFKLIDGYSKEYSRLNDSIDFICLSGL